MALGGVWAQLQEASLADRLVYVVCVAGGAATLAVLAAHAARVVQVRKTVMSPSLSSPHGSAMPSAMTFRLTLAVTAWLAITCIAFGSTGLRAAARLAERLGPDVEGRDIVLVGQIAGLPQASESGVRFRFEVASASASASTSNPMTGCPPLAPNRDAGCLAQPVQVPRFVSLGWYRGFGDEVEPNPPPADLAAGQSWRFTVRLKRPHGNMNPHGFDYELWLFEQGLRATGYVRTSAAVPPWRIAPSSGYWIDRLRQRVRDAIRDHVLSSRSAGVLAALAVGDQGSIGRLDWEVFRNTGISHLVSISGLHVTMFGWLAAMAIGALWRCGAGLALAVPAPVAARWGGLAAAAGYALCSGWGVPAQRTVWMLAAAALLQTVGRAWPWPLVLLAAGLTVVAIDPWAMLQPGFWLSFMAVGLLLASESSSRGDGTARTPAMNDAVPSMLRSWWVRAQSAGVSALRTQLVATVGLTPLTLVFFKQVSVVGFLANLFAIPLVTLVITPLALLGIAFAPCWTLGALVIEASTAALSGLAQWPWAVWAPAVAPGWAQWAGLAAALVLLLPLPWAVRGAALPLALPLLMPLPTRPPEGSFEVVAADIGQGSAVLVRTRRHALLYDTGPQYSDESDAGSRVLVPLLLARGESHLDRLVLSHRDTDHVGGAVSVLDALRVDSLLSSLDIAHPLSMQMRRSSGPAVRCEAGQGWTWDGVRFDVLHPSAADFTSSAKGANRLSCVIKVTGTWSLLLAGDIEAEQERRLVAGPASAALRSDVLMAPHHGSRTSSTSTFLEAVDPSTVIFQAGYLNRFGHPAADVVQRYEDLGVEVVTTAECGAWQAAPGSATCQRDVARRYWHWRAD